jgi:hypothetical protein
MLKSERIAAVESSKPITDIVPRLLTLWHPCDDCPNVNRYRQCTLHEKSLVTRRLARRVNKLTSSV